MESKLSDGLREHLLAVAKAGCGVIDTSCPDCGPGRRNPLNRKREVLRIWVEDGFVTCACARCGVTGWLRDGNEGRTRRGTLPKPPTRKPVSAVPVFLWSRSLPLENSPAETYLRSRGCYLPSPSLRFLPGRKDEARGSEYYPAMIARFGTGDVLAVHLTKLLPNGSGKADVEKQKIMLGHGSVGQPIVVHENDSGAELFVTEGIEDAASVALATGWTSWAAGAAARIPAVLSGKRGFGPVYLGVDDDDAGKRALEKSRQDGMDIIPVNFAKVLGVSGKLDANKVMKEHGPDAVIAAIEWCEAQERARRGDIGYDAMCAAFARARTVIESLGSG
jgi:hypothetical protein